MVKDILLEGVIDSSVKTKFRNFVERNYGKIHTAGLFQRYQSPKRSR